MTPRDVHFTIDVVEHAIATWRDQKIISEDEEPDLHERLAIIAVRTGHRGPRTLRGLATATPRERIRAAHGPTARSFVPPGKAAAWSSPEATRNLAAAMLWTFEGPAAQHFTQPDPLGPPPTPRTPLRRGRPLCDDERLLLRVVVTQQLARTRRSDRQAACYVLAESGCTVGEVSTIRPSDVEALPEGWRVLAPGDQARDQRWLPLDEWQSSVLHHLIEARDPGDDSPLAYRGRHLPGSPAANMSSHGVLDRLLIRAGLKRTDTTATSISRTAAQRADTHQGPTEASRLLGRKSEEDAAKDLRYLGATPAPVASVAVRTFLSTNPSPHRRDVRQGAATWAHQ